MNRGADELALAASPACALKKRRSPVTRLQLQKTVCLTRHDARSRWSDETTLHRTRGGRRTFARPEGLFREKHGEGAGGVSWVGRVNRSFSRWWFQLPPHRPVGCRWGLVDDGDAAAREGGDVSELSFCLEHDPSADPWPRNSSTGQERELFQGRAMVHKQWARPPVCDCRPNTGTEWHLSSILEPFEHIYYIIIWAAFGAFTFEASKPPR
jgi:hypothetical protein